VAGELIGVLAFGLLMCIAACVCCAKKKRKKPPPFMNMPYYTDEHGTPPGTPIRWHAQTARAHRAAH
jgi:hypothetical protein